MKELCCYLLQILCLCQFGITEPINIFVLLSVGFAFLLTDFVKAEICTSKYILHI